MEELDIAKQQKVCDAFLEAFRRCDPEYEIDLPNSIGFPAIVCAAFSIEVGLKLILSRSGISSDGHNLMELFTKLPNHLQIQVIEGSGFSKDNFFVQLNRAKLAFIEWRYIYENPDKRVNVYFLGKFAHSTQFIANRIYKKA